MPTLAQSLEGRDFGHFQIIAECWGIELHAKDVREAIQQLNGTLPAQLSAQWEELPDEFRKALSDLASGGGRLAWTQFSRDYGDVREMGAGRRDKEQPHHHPISTAETLWYRALIGKAFLDNTQGLKEFAFIPDELLAVLPQIEVTNAERYGRIARPEERANEIFASDHILDEACTLLAGLRVGLSDEELATSEDWRMPIPALKSLLNAAKIIDISGKPNPEATRRFLEANRGEAHALLASTWLTSDEVNDLRLIPELVTEGGWENDPLATRQRVINIARTTPANQWVSIQALVLDMKARNPDFQRPAGDYDSWYLRNAATGEYLRGFEHWDSVDGALVNYLIRGPLHWLGFIDLALPSEQQPPLSRRAGEGTGVKVATAFRWSRWAEALLNGQIPSGWKVEGSRLKIDSRGGIFVPTLAPRTIRYVISRFTDWLPKQKDAYRYQITARSLERTRKQGLEARQLMGLLKTYSSSALPPNLVQALNRWEQQGTQARIENMQVLRLNSAGALKALRASRAARYLGEPLGPTSIVIKTGAGKQVMHVLVELGYLGTLDEEIK